MRRHEAKGRKIRGEEDGRLEQECACGDVHERGYYDTRWDEMRCGEARRGETRRDETRLDGSRDMRVDVSV